jgi:vesicle transport through interaction with t-SNAREs protein 1
MGILGELRNQRETLDRAKGRLESTDTDLAKSTRTLRSMAMRARANKVVTAGIAVAVLVALLVILAWSR